MRSIACAVALAAAAAMAGCAPVPPASGYDAYAPERRVIANVNFAFDSARLQPDSYATLDNVALALNDPRLIRSRIEVDGHTDVIGRLDYNIALSRLRADSVVNFLAARGIPRERMLAQGFGPLQLLDPSNPASPTNRRVEIVSLP